MSDAKVAEFVGIMLGDGSIGIYKSMSGNVEKRQYRTKVTLNSEDEICYANNICKMIEEQFSIRPLVRFRKGEKAMDILIFNKDFLRFLTKDIGLKLSPKKYSAVIPQRFMGNGLELDVLRGYFDTDGSVVIANNNGIRYPRLEMKVCPSPLQYQIPEILRKHGFRFGVYKIDNDEIRIQMNGRNELKKWIAKIGFSNTKHCERANEFI